MVAAGFIQRAEITQTDFGPELAAAFEPALLLATGGFDRPGTNGPAAPGHRLVVHPTGLAGKVILFPPNHSPHFSASFRKSRDLAQRALFLAMAQLVSERDHPRRQSRFLFLLERPAQIPPMFAAMIKIQELGRRLPAICFQVPHPFGPIPQIQQMPGAAQPFPLGFPVEPSPQLQRLVLPVDHQFVGQPTPPGWRLRRRLMPIIHSQLQFMPFDAVLPGSLPPPSRPPIAQLAAIHHQDPQRAGAALGLTFRRRLFIPLLGLGFGPRSRPLHQGVQRRVIQSLPPFAGHLRRLFIGTGRCRGKTKLLRKTRRQFLMRSQLPARPHRTPPLPRPGGPAIVNGQPDFA